RWRYSAWLEQYMRECLEGAEWRPAEPYSARHEGKREAGEWAVVWRTDGEPPIGESYVNPVPTVQGDTHVNGLRAGLTEALREYCEFRDLLPRGVRLTPEDVWEGVSYVLSVKME